METKKPTPLRHARYQTLPEILADALRAAEHHESVRKVRYYGYHSVEVPVEELRAKADAMEQAPYGADEVIPESEAKEYCQGRQVIDAFERQYYSIDHMSCFKRGTHLFYRSEYGPDCYCEDCIRQESLDKAKAFRKEHRL